MSDFDPKPASSGRTWPDETVVAAARRWADIVAERDLTAEERERFEAWLCEYPMHETELIAALEIPIRLTEVPESERIRLRARASPITPSPQAQDKPWWTTPRLAVAAAISLLGVGMAWIVFSRHQEHYSTGTGEKYSISLPDGSRAELNSQTELEWLGVGPCDRRVRLLRGEALFEVKSDPSCRFQVLVGGGAIEVLGTRFDVYQHRDGNEELSVLDGRVRIRGVPDADSPPWEMEISAGQQVTWGEGTPITRELDVAKAMAWREERLEFTDEPLAQVIEELRRYTSTPIRIADPRLLSIHVTGILPVDSRHIHDSVLRLQERPEIQVRDEGRSFILSYRAQMSAGRTKGGR
jgi:transmembrane sensor